MVSLLKKKIKSFRNEKGESERRNSERRSSEKRDSVRSSERRSSERRDSQRRKNVRVPFSIESKVKFGDKRYNGTVLNLSFHGMLLEIKESVPINSMLEVNMIISSGNAKREMMLPGKVVRSEKKGTALRLMNLNRDSVIILKDILLQNYNDHEQIVSEFSNFIQEKAYSLVNPVVEIH